MISTKLFEYENILVLGAFGALAAQMLVARDFLDRNSKYQLLVDKKEYYGKVIAMLNNEDDKIDLEIERFQAKLIDTIATGSDEAEAECRKTIDYWQARLDALVKQRNELDIERNGVYNQLAEMKMWQLSNFVCYSIIFVVLGGFFSLFVSYALAAGGSVTITPQSAVLALMVGASWPVYFKRLWEKAEKAKIADELIDRSAKIIESVGDLRLEM